MKRITVEKPAGNMNAFELAHNCMFEKNREAWFRDYEREIPLRDLIREIAGGMKVIVPADNEDFDVELYDWLQFAPEEDVEGLLALLNMFGFALADCRERLRQYEDTGLEPEYIELAKNLAIQKIRSEIDENCYAMAETRRLGIDATAIREANEGLEKVLLKLAAGVEA